MSVESYFNPLDPDREIEDFLQEPHALEYMPHPDETMDHVYVAPRPTKPVPRRRVLRPRKPKPLTKEQILDSLIVRL